MLNKTWLFDATKRALDIGASALGFIVTAPIQIVVAIAARIFLGKPVFSNRSDQAKTVRFLNL